MCSHFPNTFFRGTVQKFRGTLLCRGTLFENPCSRRCNKPEDYNFFSMFKYNNRFYSWSNQYEVGLWIKIRRSLVALDITVMHIRTHDYWIHAIAHSSLVCNQLTLFTLKYQKSIRHRTLKHALEAFSPFISMSRFRCLQCTIAWLGRWKMSGESQEIENVTFHAIVTWHV